MSAYIDPRRTDPARLIADARSGTHLATRPGLVGELADALEQTANDIEYRQSVKLYADLYYELAAVIEQAKGMFHGPDFKESRLGRLLYSAPADALRERDARIKAEALREAVQKIWVSSRFMDTQEIRDYLRERADEIEKEAGL